MTDDKLLDKVRKLLAQAERASTEGEAEVFNAKARELIARYGIEEALLAASGQKKDSIIQRRIEMDQPYATDKSTLLQYIAVALRCTTIRLHSAARSRTRASVIIGFGSDVERVELLYTSLLLQATTQVVKVRPSWTGESVAAYRRSWLRGFATAVHHRLVAAERKAEQASTAAGDQASGVSTALVLVDRTAQVDAAMDALFPHARASRRTLTGSGTHSGYAAGTRADLGGTSVTRNVRGQVAR